MSKYIYFTPEEKARAQNTDLVSLLRAQGGATAAELRDAMGTTRKYAIPLLEHFDAQGVTRRDGDLRVLGPKRA